jgi:hypothetical protein
MACLWDPIAMLNVCPSSGSEWGVSSGGCLLYPPELCLSSSSEAVTSSASAGDIILSPEIIDSVMAVFNLGFQSGVLSFISPVGWAVGIFIVVGIFNYVISKS